MGDYEKPQTYWCLRVVLADDDLMPRVFRSFVSAYNWLVEYVRNEWYRQTGLCHMPNDDMTLIDTFFRHGEHKWSIEECIICF